MEPINNICEELYCKQCGRCPGDGRCMRSMDRRFQNISKLQLQHKCNFGCETKSCSKCKQNYVISQKKIVDRGFCDRCYVELSRSIKNDTILWDKIIETVKEHYLSGKK